MTFYTHDCLNNDIIEWFIWFKRYTEATWGRTFIILKCQCQYDLPKNEFISTILLFGSLYKHGRHFKTKGSLDELHVTSMLLFLYS